MARFASFQVCRLYSANVSVTTAGTSTLSTVIFNNGATALATASVGTTTAGANAISVLLNTSTLSSLVNFKCVSNDATGVFVVGLEFDHDPSSTYN